MVEITLADPSIPWLEIGVGAVATLGGAALGAGLGARGAYSASVRAGRHLVRREKLEEALLLLDRITRRDREEMERLISLAEHDYPGNFVSYYDNPDHRLHEGAWDYVSFKQLVELYCTPKLNLAIKFHACCSAFNGKCLNHMNFDSITSELLSPYGEWKAVSIELRESLLHELKIK